MSKTHYLRSLADLPLRRVETGSGEQLGLQFDLSEDCGTKRLRLSFERLLPGMRQAPPHRHSTREEGFLVLRGRGSVLVGEARVAVSSGDVMIFLPGEAQFHSLRNDGDEPLDLFVFSSEDGDDVVTYADSET